MDIHITGDPGTGNSFTDIHIDTVQNFNPNAKTVINYNYGDRRKQAPPPDTSLSDEEQAHRKEEVLHYVMRLREQVSRDWKNRYDTLWEQVLSIPEVAEVIFESGRQKDTTFNRNLVANIIYIMCNEGVIAETNATTLTEILEGNKGHSVRAQLRAYPENREITSKVSALIVS